ncbi:hypothetical protein JCM11957_00560 [Caminibacter profundus]
MESEKFEYIKEEIITYRELLKLFVLIEIAILGGSLNLILDIFKNFSMTEFIFVVVGFISFLINLVIIKKIWQKLYEYKFILKDKQ